ncbi:ribbon-helix-helix protein, CopG family [Teichococcus oryzae]|uniref:ribbon-helix-helix protein, CopG family n=1 Tax=Teichococcus oryzae TaxID=1608942 RepID=UPI0013755015|nr:ribbon-helix-helix protein, CopG family [Pseudoroseomonas oryzae]
MDTLRRSVHLTSQQAEALQNEASRLGITFNELLRRIVDEWRFKDAHGGARV